MLYEVITHGAARLAEVLGLSPCSGRTHLVLGMLDDKDVVGFVAELSSVVDHWYPSSLDIPRGLSAGELDQRMRGLLSGNRIHPCMDVPTACREAGKNASAGDRIVVSYNFV